MKLFFPWNERGVLLVELHKLCFAQADRSKYAGLEIKLQ